MHCFSGCPYVFVTNSTGYTEAMKARAIAATLGRPVDASKMIMAHSSMRLPLSPLQV
jgi:ribonucleotide monophosphatase NagD (HAD superfamily)